MPFPRIPPKPPNSTVLRPSTKARCSWESWICCSLLYYYTCTTNVDLKLAVSASPGSLCEMQILRPSSSPPNQNLHFNSIPRPFVGTVKGKKLWSFTVLGIPSWNTYFSLSLPCPLGWFASLLSAWTSPSLPPGSRGLRDNGFILMSPKCILVKMS